jgi:hypothetical protein
VKLSHAIKHKMGNEVSETVLLHITLTAVTVRFTGKRME